MRVVVLYHPKSDHGGRVEDYAHDFERFKGQKLELLSLETKEGANLATLYDVTRYPAVLAIAEDGSLHKLWMEDSLPLMDEVSAYQIDSLEAPSNDTKVIDPPSGTQYVNRFSFLDFMPSPKT